jgi:hypothetical protein
VHEDAINFVNRIDEWFWEVEQHRLRGEFPLEQSAMPPSVFAQVPTFGILPICKSPKSCRIAQVTSEYPW